MAVPTLSPNANECAAGETACVVLVERRVLEVRAKARESMHKAEVRAKLSALKKGAGSR